MYLYEIFLLVLSTVGLSGIPVYVFFRSRMVKSLPNYKAFGQRRILKMLGLHILCTVPTFLIFLMILISLLAKRYNFEPNIIILSIVFFVIMGLSFYGAGIYITSIVLEAFTLPQLREVRSFKTQFIATHLFHGPVSHILIFSGGILGLFTLAVIDLMTGTGTLGVSNLMTLGGVAVGVIYALGNIYNHTTLYQYFTTAVSLLAYLFVYTHSSRGPLFHYSVGIYFVAFSIAFLVCCSVYLIYEKGKKINLWDMSGNYP